MNDDSVLWAQMPGEQMDAAMASGRAFTDMLHTVPDRMGDHEGAAKWVVDRGKETDEERMLQFTPVGGELVDPDSFTIHHNRPESTALSGPDIGMTAWPGASHVVAVATMAMSFTPGSMRIWWTLALKIPNGFIKSFNGLKDQWEHTYGKAFGWSGCGKSRSPRPALKLTISRCLAS